MPWPRWICGRRFSLHGRVRSPILLEKRYRALGGDITVIAKPGVGHHPHSLKDPAPIVEFVLRSLSR